MRNGSASSANIPTTFESSQTGTSVWGLTSYYAFDVVIDPESGISSFHIIVREGATKKTYTNEGKGYPVQDMAFVVPSMSDVKDNGEAVVTAAVNDTIFLLVLLFKPFY